MVLLSLLLFEAGSSALLSCSAEDMNKGFLSPTGTCRQVVERCVVVVKAATLGELIAGGAKPETGLQSSTEKKKVTRRSIVWRILLSAPEIILMGLFGNDRLLRIKIIRCRIVGKLKPLCLKDVACDQGKSLVPITITTINDNRMMTSSHKLIRSERTEKRGSSENEKTSFDTVQSVPSR